MAKSCTLTHNKKYDMLPSESGDELQLTKFHDPKNHSFDASCVMYIKMYIRVCQVNMKGHSSLTLIFFKVWNNSKLVTPNKQFLTGETPLKEI